MTRSRREIFVTHDDPARLARCPVCQRAIELDHEEALRVQAGGAQPARPAACAVPAPLDEPEAEAVVGFALV